MYLRKKAAILIIKVSKIIYKSKTYDKAIANPIYSIKWQQAIKKFTIQRYIILGSMKNYQKAKKPLNINKYLR